MERIKKSYKAMNNMVELLDRTCVVCGNCFQTSRSHKKYCSLRCYKRAYYDRHKDEILGKQKYAYHNDETYRKRILDGCVRYRNNPVSKEKRQIYMLTYRTTLSYRMTKRREYERHKERYSKYLKNYRLHNGEKLKIRGREYFKNSEAMLKRMERSRRYREKQRTLENVRRASLGLPLIGMKYAAEAEMRLFLNKYMLDMGVFFDNKYWKSENNKLVRASSKAGLQLDRYYPEANLAFEYDGRQHFKFSKLMHGTVERYLKSVERDERKDEMCEQTNTALIRVNYLEKIDVLTFGEKFKEHPMIEVIS